MAQRTAVAWDEGKNAQDNARLYLPVLAREFFAAGRKLIVGEQPTSSSNGLADALAEERHRFRLLTKRFRYTLELFRPFYGTGLDRRMASLRKLQQFLGAISDSRSTKNLLSKTGNGKLPAKLARHLDRQSDESWKELKAFWVQKFDAAGQEPSWIRFLER